MQIPFMIELYHWKRSLFFPSHDTSSWLSQQDIGLESWTRFRSKTGGKFRFAESLAQTSMAFSRNGGEGLLL